jgi:hypothetical protein
MRFGIWLTFAAVLGGSTPVLAADQVVTANAILKWYDAGTADDKKIVLLTVHATEDGIAWATVLAKSKGVFLYCPPEKIALAPEQVLSMLRHGVDEHPAWGTAAYGLSILLVLQDAFPCP